MAEEGIDFETHNIKGTDIRVRKPVPRAERLLRKENLSDALTGVGNYRALERWLTQDQKRQEHNYQSTQERRNEKFSYPTYGVAIFLDVDGLGNANEEGHEVGDTLIKCVADAGKKITQRPNDAIFRRGDKSDEFIIFLPGDNLESFELLEKKYNEALLEKSGGRNFTASLALGIYGHGRSAAETIKILDKELSKEKSARGKGQHIETIFYRQ